MHPMHYEFMETVAQAYRAERESRAELARLARATTRHREAEDAAGVERRLLAYGAAFSVVALGLALLGAYALGPLS